MEIQMPCMMIARVMRQAVARKSRPLCLPMLPSIGDSKTFKRSDDVGQVSQGLALPLWASQTRSIEIPTTHTDMMSAAEPNTVSESMTTKS